MLHLPAKGVIRKMRTKRPSHIRYGKGFAEFEGASLCELEIKWLFGPQGGYCWLLRGGGVSSYRYGTKGTARDTVHFDAAG